MNSEDIFKLILLIIVAVIFVFLAMSYLDFIQPKDDFCIEKGFNGFQSTTDVGNKTYIICYTYAKLITNTSIETNKVTKVYEYLPKVNQ